MFHGDVAFSVQCQESGEILAAIVVDDIDNCAMVVFHGDVGQQPYPWVAFRTQIPGHFAKYFLSWHTEALLVGINGQVDLILFIKGCASWAWQLSDITLKANEMNSFNMVV